MGLSPTSSPSPTLPPPHLPPMRSKPILLLFFLGSFRGALSLRYQKWCFDGCELNINYVNFNDTEAGSKKFRSCHSLQRATSLYLCFHEFCVDEGRNEWIDSASETCQRLANTTLPPYDIISDFTPEQIAGIRRLGADEALTFPLLNEVIIPDEPFFQRSHNTLDAAFSMYDLHWLYGWCMFYFWIGVVAIGIGARLVSLISNLRRNGWQPIPEDDSSLENQSQLGTYSIFRKPYALIKRHVLYPATFGYRCSQNVWWCTIPPRVQSLTISAFVLLNIVVCTTNYRVTHGNLYWSNEWVQLCRYISDRTGIISVANFPLIWLFGTRNNTLMWLTGWGFGAYNNFHRWVARVSTVQAVIHSIGYTIMIHESGGWSNLWRYFHKHYFWNGELATIFMCALLAFSVYGLRRSHYEIFLITHIVFSIVVLWTMYYHVEIFPDGDFNIFIWPCLAIWIWDRGLRGFRILAYDRRFWSTKATATYDPASHLVTLEVSSSHSIYTPQPGTYYYIYVLNNFLYAHQNHPFTLAYVASKDSPDSPEPPVAPHIRPSPRRTNSNESTESDALLAPSASDSSSLVFLIRPYDGFTSRLAKSCALRPQSLRVLVEGPYGHTVPLRSFANILFIVGGTGVAVPLSHLANLLSGESPVTRLKIVWAVREHAFLASVVRDFRALLEDERVILEVHVTQDEEPKDDSIAEEIKGVRIEGGRPDIDEVVEDAASEVGEGRLAIVACGPGQMADQARRASVQALGRGHSGVEYFEESFKW